MLNPAYLDVLDSPYLNYAKSPEESNVETKSFTENFKDSSSINTDYPNEFTLYIVYFLTMLGFIVYFLNVKNMEGRGPFYLAIYLIILVIGTGAYYFSHI